MDNKLELIADEFVKYFTNAYNYKFSEKFNLSYVSQELIDCIVYGVDKRELYNAIKLDIDDFSNVELEDLDFDFMNHTVDRFMELISSNVDLFCAKFHEVVLDYLEVLNVSCNVDELQKNLLNFPDSAFSLHDLLISNDPNTLPYLLDMFDDHGVTYQELLND